MKSMISQITNCIERTYDICGNDFHEKIIIYPYGDIGIQVANILRNVYDVEPAYILDNHKCKYNRAIKPVSWLDELDNNEFVIILASINTDIYIELRKSVLDWVNDNHLIELECMKERMKTEPFSFFHTDIGKYSYGPICRNHVYIKSIGSFCSFAEGVNVVPNHEMHCITTHPMISRGQGYDGINIDYDMFAGERWHFDGVSPKGCTRKGRITIGNDVWLGANVIITNYANIGNGVIAGAGAIITKDVPDYAIVAGVPARIIKYRYTQAQIEQLNMIKWWDWSDDLIRERFEDFYIPIEDFIKKYGR